MNFDEFACLAESNAKSWFDNYYDMCANEEFGLANNGMNPSMPVHRSDPDNSTITKTTAKNHLDYSSEMQSGTENSVTTTPTPVSVSVKSFFSPFKVLF